VTGESSQATYLYAVARPFGAEALEGVRGVGGHAVHLVVQDDLAAVVGRVPLDEFGEEALRARLEDLDWLEAVARAHDGVVETVMRRAAAVPLRLATVYRGDERVREVLAQGHDRFDRVLRRLADRLEFGVKVYAEPAALRREQPEEERESAPSSAGESPGRAYLRKRNAQRRRHDDVWQAASALVDRADAALGEWAEAREVHRPQDASLSGAPGENVMNAAYLVSAEHARTFLDTMERLRAQAPAGTRIEVSGPWAPYSFASLDESEEPA
jgi:hypothetical protein